jgi:hypothetical protein
MSKAVMLSGLAAKLYTEHKDNLKKMKKQLPAVVKERVNSPENQPALSGFANFRKVLGARIGNITFDVMVGKERIGFVVLK